ncbi:MAG: GNAT family N-acetyltransferase [Burkholderiales bacterium]|nr:GNAT family N-acetyltransferase [Burkholderiales bacterium]
MRQLWADPVFMRAFHRLAPPLPPDDRELQRVLQAECNNPIAKTRALHWVVRSPDRQPWGLLSLTDMSLQHKRAEVLIGVLPNAPFALASAAMLMLFHFYFREKKFNKLYSLVFADNPHSLKSTLHLGFRQEGLLKGHIYDAASQGYVDLIQTGLLAQDAFSASNLRLMQKLLAH